MRRLVEAQQGLQIDRCDACGHVRVVNCGIRNELKTATLHPILPALPGTQLRNRYRLGAVLGEGAHGVTYLAEHLFVRQTFVAKLLRQRIASSSDPAVERMRREAAIGFRLSDPHVVRVVDFDAVDGVLFFIMEHVDGVDLERLLDADVRFTPRQVARIGHEIIRGLCALHRAGLIHRDIKPSNLMLGRDDRARIIDLGVVGFVDDASRDSAGLGYSSAGTLRYAAPERTTPDGVADQRSDLYSVGVVLYELCTGRMPFECNSVFQSLLEPHRGQAAWPADATDTPDWLISLVLSMLALDPRERPASAEEVRQVFEARLGGRGPSNAAAKPVEKTPQGVVVGRFEDEDAPGETWLALALAESLARQLSADPDLHVADREELQRLLARLGPASGPTDVQRRCAAARLLGAAQIVEGRFRELDGRLTVRLSMLSAVDQRVRELEPIEGPLSELAPLRRAMVRAARRAMQLDDGPRLESAAAHRESGIAAQERFFRGKRAYLEGDYEEAGRLGREAITLDPDFGEGVGFVGVCASKTGRYDEAAEFLARQQRIAVDTDDARLGVEALANLGAMHYYRGEYERAFTSYAAAAHAAKAGGFRSDLAKISSNLGFVLLQLGRAEQAEGAYRKAIEVHQAVGARASLIGPFNGLANVLREQGRLDDARSLHRQAIRLAMEAEDSVNVGVGYMYLGRCESQCQRYTQAKRSFAVAVNVLEGTRFWNGLTRLFGFLAEMNLQLRDGHEALRCADRVIELAQRHMNKRLEETGRRQRDQALELIEVPAAASDETKEAAVVSFGPAFNPPQPKAVQFEEPCGARS